MEPVVPAMSSLVAVVYVCALLVIFYLSANKVWQVKHERPVATSISLASYGLYLLVVTVSLVTHAVRGAAWHAVAEAALLFLNSAFMVAVGAGWWVSGERSKGFIELVLTSLRSERQQLGALAKALTNPAGTRKIIDILTQVAMIDGVLEDREKAFIQVFADSWGIQVDWFNVAGRAPGPPEAQYAHLRRDVEAYVALSPPKDQALHLADLIVRLVNADDQVTATEALISTELTALLEKYGGRGGKPTYEVHIVPQSPEQANAITGAFPQMKRRVLPSGLILVAATCYSRDYATVLQQQYTALNFYAAIAAVEG